MNKVAFFGPAFIHKGFSEMDPNWDFQQPFETIEDLGSALGNEDMMSRETCMFIFFSGLYEEDPSNFAYYASYLIPYGVVCILIPEMEMKNKPKIEASIKESQMEFAKNDSSYNLDIPFYFVNYDYASQEIHTAIESYIKSNANKETKDLVKKLLPDYSDIDIQEDIYTMDEQFEEEYEVPQAKGDGQVIAITSSKGGSGKSTLSILFSSYIAKTSKESYENGKILNPVKVCVVDLDTRDGQIGLLNGTLKPNAMDIITEGGEITPETIQKGIWHNEVSGVDYVFAPKRPRTAQAIPYTFYAKLIQELRGMYDVIILDTSIHYDDLLRKNVAYPIADVILLISDLIVSSVFGLTRWIEEETSSNGANIDINKVGAVINKMLPNVNMPYQKIERALNGVPVLAMIPSLPTSITFAANTGRLHEMLDKNAPLIKQFQTLAESVLRIPLK